MALVLALGAPAQSAGTRPDFAPFKFLIGHWTCSGAGRTFHLTYGYALATRWLLGTSVRKKTGTMVRDAVQYNYLTYDSTLKTWLGFVLDNDADYDYYTTTAPTNGVMVYKENPSTAAGLPVWTFTLTILDPRHTSGKYVGPLDAAGHVGTTVTTCSKN
jgi:hypothetical protein